MLVASATSCRRMLIWKHTRWHRGTLHTPSKHKSCLTAGNPLTFSSHVLRIHLLLATDKAMFYRVRYRGIDWKEGLTYIQKAFLSSVLWYFTWSRLFFSIFDVDIWRYDTAPHSRLTINRRNIQIFYLENLLVGQLIWRHRCSCCYICRCSWHTSQSCRIWRWWELLRFPDAEGSG